MTKEAVPRLVWSPELVARFWDYHARHPESYFTNLYGDVIAQRLQPYVGNGRRVLDYGAGAGFLIEHLLQQGNRVTALDYSPASVDAIRERYAGRSGFEGAYDTEQLAREGHTFDALVCVEVVEHLEEEQLRDVLDDVRRLLVPGGLAVFTTPNREDLAASDVYCPVSDVVFHRWQHVRSWDRHTLSIALQDAGFTVSRTFETDFSARRRLSRHYASLAVRSALGRTQGLPHLVAVAVR